MAQYRLKASVGADRPADLEDVWGVKRNLNLNVHYEWPDYGLTPYPDRQLFEAIQTYQRQHGLRVDGLMKPGGETEAHVQDNLPEKAPHSGASNAAPGTEGFEISIAMMLDQALRLI